VQTFATNSVITMTFKNAEPAEKAFIAFLFHVEVSNGSIQRVDVDAGRSLFNGGPLPSKAVSVRGVPQPYGAASVILQVTRPNTLRLTSPHLEKEMVIVIE
jgi:hypothetical protein